MNSVSADPTPARTSRIRSKPEASVYLRQLYGVISRILRVREVMILQAKSCMMMFPPSPCTARCPQPQPEAHIPTASFKYHNGSAMTHKTSRGWRGARASSFLQTIATLRQSSSFMVWANLI
ncbi:hypothetical protein E4T56_gene969 [Termitomyces sp. T112]|nr:hypothetical protein E4T56_gene969 [Termitomyces sp. T112]